MAMAKKQDLDLSTEEAQSLITLLCQHHAIHGELFTKEYAVEEYGFDSKFINTAYSSRILVAALQERGIELDHYDFQERVNSDNQVPAYRSKALTATQLIVANTMLDLVDTRSQKKKLQDLNVSTSTYNSWLRDPVFSKYLHERAEALLGDNMHEAHLALLDKVRAGDTRAISLYYELTGRHVSQSSIAPNQQAFNANSLIVAMIDLINDECDPATAVRISERLRLLATARTVAGELISSMDEPISAPTVTPMRMLNAVPDITSED